MLRLKSRTSGGWLEHVSAHIDELLIDHAHCEKKAASTALSLIFRYPQYPILMRPLSELAREELEHFELVLDCIEARGYTFVRQRPSPYAGRLTQAIRTGEDERLLDTLLCAALIEARSCERMQILADGLEDSSLAEMYRSLLESEARHHGLYVRLAQSIFDGTDVNARLNQLSEHEAEILNLPSYGPRMHSQASNG